MRALKIAVSVLVLALGFAAVVFSAAHPSVELALKKQPFFGGIGPGYNPNCFGLFYVDGDKDVPDLREFRLFLCNGRYTFSMKGPAEKLVTLFAGFNYSLERGYLIIKKTDDRLVWVDDLEAFKPRQWVKVEADESGYGGYEVYYEPGPLFEQFVASVKWGRWWQGDSLPLRPNR
jgi:hypothetical protein